MPTRESNLLRSKILDGYIVCALLFLIGCGNTPRSHEEQSSSDAVMQKAIKWEVTEKTDEMDHSKTQDLSQSSSTSDAVLRIECSNKGTGNKLREHSHFTLIYFGRTGRIPWVNGRWEQVRYKFEDDVVHEPFWWTGSDHDAFLVPAGQFGPANGTSLLKQMLKHEVMTVEFSPGARLAKFNLQGLSDALDGIQCRIDGSKNNGNGNRRSGEGIDDAGASMPQLVLKVQPIYSEEARAANYSATVVLSVLVDENGLPRDIRVIRPAGLGLDEKAVDAVSNWRYRPGVKDGRAVPVRINVDVPFRLSQ